MRRQFYALPDDLLAVFCLVENSQLLRYTAMDFLPSPIPISRLSGAELPTLRAPPPVDSASSGHRYLVTMRDVEPIARKIKLEGGGVSYVFDQLENPNSIELLPGACHESGAILYGRIATCSDSADSERLFGLFKRAISKQFRKIKSFWVGPGAELSWRQGARLTIGLSSPQNYDLREPHARAAEPHAGADR